MAYRIKEVDGTDEDVADTIRELHEECFADSAPQVNPEQGYWWLAFAIDERREIAGFCGLTHSDAGPAYGYLKRAGVLASHRGHALQRRFVRVREAKARRLGITTMLTDTTDNPSSSNNLIRCGYRIFIPEAPWKPWGFHHTIYWTKDL